MPGDTIKIPVEFKPDEANEGIQELIQRLADLKENVKETGEESKKTQEGLSKIAGGLSLAGAVAGFSQLASAIVDATTEADRMSGAVRSVHGHLVDAHHGTESLSTQLRTLQNVGHNAFQNFAVNAGASFMAILHVNQGLHETNGTGMDLAHTMGEIGQVVGRVAAGALEAGRFVVDGLRMIFEAFKGYATSGAHALAGLFSDIIHGRFEGIGQRFLETLGDVSAETTRRLDALSRDSQASIQGIRNAATQTLAAPIVAPTDAAVTAHGGHSHVAQRAHQLAEEWAHAIEEQASHNPDAISAGGVLAARYAEIFQAKFGEHAPAMVTHINDRLRQEFQKDQRTIADTARSALERGLHDAVAGQGEAREGRAPTSEQADAIAHQTENRAALQRSIDADTAALQRWQDVAAHATAGSHAMAAADIEATRIAAALRGERELALTVDNQARLNDAARLAAQRTLVDGELAALNEARTAAAAHHTLTAAETDALSHQGDAVRHLTELHSGYVSAIAATDAELRRANVPEQERNALLVRRMQLQQQDSAIQGQLRTESERTTQTLTASTQQLKSALGESVSAFATQSVAALENGKFSKKAEEEALHGLLASLSQKGVAKSLEMTAEGLSDLASFDYPAAGLAFAAAAAWGALAAATGAGAAATNAPSGASAGGGGAGTSEAAPAGSASTSRGSAGTSHTTIIQFNAPVIGPDLSHVGDFMAKAINENVRQSGTQLNSNAVSGS
jgi:hypothetical protein